MSRRLSSLLRSDQRLDALLKHARRLADLERLVRARLDPELAAHCRVSGGQDGLLLLEVDGQAWATRLRYQTRQLLADLERAGVKGFTEVRLRLARDRAVPSRPVRRARLGPSGAATLREAADSIDDPALSQALRRLAGRGRGSN